MWQICIGPVCIPIAALYGVLPVIYLLWDKILGFLSIFFPSLKKAPKSNTPEEEAKLLAGLAPEALARLEAGTKGGVSDVDDEERWGPASRADPTLLAPSSPNVTVDTFSGKRGGWGWMHPQMRFIGVFCSGGTSCWPRPRKSACL